MEQYLDEREDFLGQPALQEQEYVRALGRSWKSTIALVGA